MSTYLIAVVISDFKCRSTFYTSKLTNKNTTIEICAKPTASDQLDLAFNSSVSLLEFFETYYNVSYPLPKLGKTFKNIHRQLEISKTVILKLVLQFKIISEYQILNTVVSIIMIKAKS
jgi:aminopeptidase N